LRADSTLPGELLLRCLALALAAILAAGAALPAAPAPSDRPDLSAALRDPDPIVRLRALRVLAIDPAGVDGVQAPALGARLSDPQTWGGTRGNGEWRWPVATPTTWQATWDQPSVDLRVGMTRSSGQLDCGR
jgi:hypothetical protein